MKRFFSIEQALDHVSKTLIPERHNYIVNILPPEGADAEEEEKTPQVTSHHMEFHDGNVGLTIALPFEPESEEFGQLAEYLNRDLAGLVSTGQLDGAPRYFLNLGSDAQAATQAVLYLLEAVAGYPPGSSYFCVVHDEGQV